MKRPVGHSAEKSRKTAKRIVAIVLLLLFLNVMLLSEVFIFTHTGHDHDHNGADDSCVTCAQIQAAGNLLKQFNISAGVMSFAFVSGMLAIVFLCYISSLIGFQTLVKLKARMNN